MDFQLCCPVIVRCCLARNQTIVNTNRKEIVQDLSKYVSNYPVKTLGHEFRRSV